MMRGTRTSYGLRREIRTERGRQTIEEREGKGIISTAPCRLLLRNGRKGKRDAIRGDLDDEGFCTGLGERAVHTRLGELAPVARGNQEAGYTQPLGPTLSPSHENGGPFLTGGM